MNPRDYDPPSTPARERAIAATNRAVARFRRPYALSSAEIEAIRDEVAKEIESALATCECGHSAVEHTGACGACAVCNSCAWFVTQGGGT